MVSSCVGGLYEKTPSTASINPSAMTKISFYTMSIYLMLVIWSCTSVKNEVTSPQLFNENWKFFIVPEGEGKAFHDASINDEKWEDVKLPHTPRYESLVVNDQWQGICWYRKHFQIPVSEHGKKVFIRFEGAMNRAEVWLNGVKLSEHQGGYLPFSVDLSDELKFGETNILAVKLDNRDNPVTGPKPLEILDFNMYGGLYRNVWLEIKNPVHITDPVFAAKVASGGVFVTYPEVSESQAVIRVQTHIVNTTGKSEKVQLVHRLFDGESALIVHESAIFEIASGGDGEMIEEMKMTDPKLWSPEFPNLYRLETEVLLGSKVVDRQETRIGIRRFEFRENDFYLNGEKLFLRGVNRHQEYPFVGYALSDNAQYRDALKIKNAGFDYVRLSHYPHSESFMDACDELGLVVIDAILGWQYFSEDTLFQNHVLQTARDMIRRDRNHACVLAWEVSLNESWQPRPFIDKLIKVAHEEFPGDQCFTAGWQEYGYDIYLQARQHRLQHYNEKLNKPYVVSEYGDWEYYAMNAGLSQDTWQDMLPVERSSRQLRGAGEARLLQQALNIQEAHNDNFNTPAFADGYWVMYDYNRGYADDLESSGLMDIFRLPKYSYYFYKSQRSAGENHDLYDGGPMVFIANEWTNKSAMEVRVFSNCEEVELKLNGNVIARQKPDENRITTNLARPPFTFKLDSFLPGLLEATGFIGSEPVVHHQVRTPETPVKLVMEYDESNRKIEAGCNDVFFVYIMKQDKNGTVVPDSEGAVALSIEGHAKLINTESMKFEAGIATALIMAGDQKGILNLKAIAEGLEDAILSIAIH